jgi:dimethylargininase
VTEPQTPTTVRRVIASLAAALVVAAIAHVFTILVFIVANQLSSNSQIVPGVNGQFAPSTLFFLIALFVFGFIGIYRTWYFAAAAGLVLGVASVIGGTTVYAASSGQSVSIADQFALLLGLNMPFVLAAVLGTIFAGTRVSRAMLGQRAASVTGRRIALVREPAANLDQGISTTGAVVDLELANQQWDDYVSALLDNGWSTVEVQSAPDLADSVFVEDTAVVFGPLAVVTSPGAASRVAETAATEVTLREQGLRVERIQTPGTLDGGDVLQIGTTVYVGRGDRTNAEGIRQLRAILAGSDYTVVAVPVTRALHLKSAVTALPDGTVIGHPSVVDDVSVFERFLAMPEKGAEVVVLAPDTVLMAASAPQSQALVASLGYRVVSVDISEFEKLDGCVTCLSVLVP